MASLLNRAWTFFSDYRNEQYDSEEEKNDNRLLNRATVAGILLVANTVFLIAGLISLAVFEIVTSPGIDIPTYSLVYLSVPLGFIVYMIILFFVKNAFKANRLGILLLALGATGYNFVFSLVIGPASGWPLYITPWAFAMGLYPDKRPSRKFLAFLILAAAVVPAFIFAMRVEPAYPLPGFVEQIIWKISVGFTLFMSVVIFLFYAWQWKLAPRLADWWQRIGNLGAELYDNDEDRRVNAVSNQGLTILVIFATMFLVMTLSLCVWVGLIDFDQYWTAFLIFPPAPLLLTFVQFYLLRTKIKSKYNVRFEVLAGLAILVALVYGSVLLGRDSGLYIFLATLIPAPFLSVHPSKLRKFLGFIAITVVVAGTMWLLTQLEGVFQLPPQVSGFIFQAVISFLLLTFVTGGIYYWMKSQMTRRLLELWNRITERGGHLFDDPTDRKFKRIQSSLIIVGAALQGFMLLNIIAIAIFTRFFPLETQAQLDGLMVYYATASGLQVAILALMSYWNGRTRSLAPSVISYLAIIFAGVVISVSLSRESLYYLSLLLAVPLPFFALNRQYKKERIIGNLGVVLTIACGMISFWYHDFYEPLRPVVHVAPRLLTGLKLIFLPTVYATIAIIAVYMTKHVRSTENSLEEEKDKSEKLLLNILPKDVADELKEKGFSEPVRFEAVTVMFTDFQGFTRIAETLDASELVSELDNCFSYFDQVTEKYNLEKLKTIGDAFMCAGGVPTPNYTHALDCCLAAMEIQAFMNQMKEFKQEQNIPYWELRLGLNTGPLVAGVVGEKKFAYDVWGDTVNTASRMESSGTVGKLNISRSTYNQVHFFFDCTYRGEVPAKNKGMVHMYYLDGLKPKYSVDGAGEVPNERFLELYEKIKIGGRAVAKN